MLYEYENDNHLSKDLDKYLENIKAPTFSHQKNYDWLLSDWNDDEWKLPRKNKQTFIDDKGEVINPIIIYWKQLLPNGRFLTDQENSYILERIRRVIALMRSGYDGRSDRSEQQYHTSIYLFSIVRWMVLNGFADTPRVMTFSALTEIDYKAYCNKLYKGWLSIEDVLQRISHYLDNISSKEHDLITLKSGRIDRVALGKTLNISSTRLERDPAVDIHLRYYEKCSCYPTMYISKHGTNLEYISNRSERIIDKANKYVSETTLNNSIGAWNYLYLFSNSSDGLLSFNPYYENTHTDKLRDLKYTKKGRTPNIPIHTALYYLDHAIKWVVDYGIHLIKYKNSIEDEISRLQGDSKDRREIYGPRAFENITKPAELNDFIFDRYHRHPTGTKNKIKRESLSLLDAIDCLTAACFIVIATFTARRRQEILELKDDAISDEYDGHVLEFGIEKSSAHHILDTTKRPVPVLVNITCNLLGCMYLKEKNDSSNKLMSDYLFTYRKGNKLSPFKNNKIINNINLFADIINVPTYKDKNDNSVTRRWYLRPHECRRFFAYTYFWNSNDSSLEALCWFMGHLTTQETERYISNSIGASEIPETLSELTISALYNNETKADLEALKDLTFNHFNVDNIEFIDKNHLSLYLKELYESGELDIEIVNIPGSDIKEVLCVKIKGAYNG